jgi:glycosyltransferase involved in cell wall biosynthesis
MEYSFFFLIKTRGLFMKKIFSFVALAVVCMQSMFASDAGSTHNYSLSKSRSHKIVAKKKVLFIVPWLVLGGMDRAFLDMIHFLPLANKDYDVCILERGGIFEQFLPKEVNLVTLEQAQAKSYDVAVSYAQWISPYILLNKIKAKRRVQWVHTDLLHCDIKFAIFKDRKKYKQIDAFVGVSKKASKSVRTLCPSVTKRVKTIYNFMDTESIKRKSLEMDVSAEIVKPEGELAVVTVCRIAGEKGIERSISVHKRLESEGIHFRWYIVGSGPDEYMARLKDQAKSAGLEDRFIFLGHRLNPYPYIKAADVFVLASFYEGCCIVISESEILGRPTLATDTGGVREQIDSGKNGLIVDNTEEAIYEGLKKLLQDASLREQFSENLEAFTYDNTSICRKVLHTLLEKQGDKIFQKSQKKLKQQRKLHAH